MKLRTVAIVAGFGTALCGALMLTLANQAPKAQPSTGINFYQPKHPVTEAMREKTAAFARKKAPPFEVEDSEGKPLTIGGSRDGRLQFVYFVMDSCPCSVDVEPLFQGLWKHFDRKIDFVAVTDADAKTAKDWSFKMLMPYPIVADPKLDIMRAYEAPSSVYSALISGDGHIIKMWPGYSQDLLADMNATMAAAMNQPVRPFDAAYAPKKQATGCAFAL